MSNHTSPAPTLANMHIATSCVSPGMVIVVVTGEVDMATAPALHAALLDALNDHAPAVVDLNLSACTFLDCSGIRVLVSAHATAQARGCQMWARYPQRIVRLVLEMTGLLDVFTAPDDTTAKTAGVERSADPASLPGSAETDALSLTGV
jgi:anti-anti-sigma factor